MTHCMQFSLLILDIGPDDLIQKRLSKGLFAHAALHTRSATLTFFKHCCYCRYYLFTRYINTLLAVKIMHAAVTGGAGFIGSHLTEALIARGDTVTVIDNLSTGCLDNIRAIKDKIAFIQADVCTDDLAQHFEGADVVFHLAALTSVPESLEQPERYDQVNAQGTLRVLEAARQAGVKRVINSSSAAVYGNDTNLPNHEHTTGTLQSPYAITKLATEHYCQMYSQIHNLDTVTLCYFNVFGPRQLADSPYASVIQKFIKTMKQHQSPTIYGDGTQTRDFIYVSDVVAANINAATAPSPLQGKRINIASGRQTSINEIVNVLNAILDTNMQPKHEPSRAGDIKHSQADITRAKQVLGTTPKMRLETGLRILCESTKL